MADGEDPRDDRHDGLRVLDNPAWHALRGPQRRFGEVQAEAARYLPDVTPFAALPDSPSAESFRALAELVGPGGIAFLTRPVDAVPEGWELVGEGLGVQMVGDHAQAAPVPDDAVVLGAGDVDDMLALVARAEPGPFLPRTFELGTYLGIRAPDGELIAMAGERMRPPGFAEISAVCTDQRYRGRGLGAGLVRAMVGVIRDRGEVAFLHAAATNTGAIALYERLGFRVRHQATFRLLRATDGHAV
jgi:ribosomal protein S18 acetylase RimI-like enzyme